MNTTIRTAADTPWERAKMEQIVRADIAAFGSGRAEMANAMIEQSGMRVRPERNRGRSAGINPSGRFEPVSAPCLRRRLELARGTAAVQDRSAGREAAHDHHPQRIRPTSPSTARSIPIAAASMAASTASRGRRTPIMGLSPGLDFESKLFAKPDAAKLLDKELSKDGYQPRTIAIGTNTDPYQPIEKH